MSKIDLKKDLKNLYNPTAKEVVLLEVPEMNFLMIDGIGDPNTSSDFQEAIEALYGVSYTLKFMIKKGPAAVDCSVMPLEGLWWSDDMSDFTSGNKDGWQWTLMIMQPEYVSTELYAEACREVKKKKNLPALVKMRFAAYHEGLSAQLMHLGPFSAEGPTIARMHSFIEEKGYQLAGKHHEIYLSDLRKTAPDKLKTVLRQPIKLIL